MIEMRWSVDPRTKEQTLQYRYQSGTSVTYDIDDGIYHERMWTEWRDVPVCVAATQIPSSQEGK